VRERDSSQSGAERAALPDAVEDRLSGARTADRLARLDAVSPVAVAPEDVLAAVHAARGTRHAMSFPARTVPQAHDDA
jgi:hypothetical protein